MKTDQQRGRIAYEAFYAAAMGYNDWDRTTDFVRERWTAAAAALAAAPPAPKVQGEVRRIAEAIEDSTGRLSMGADVATEQNVLLKLAGELDSLPAPLVGLPADGDERERLVRLMTDRYVIAQTAYDTAPSVRMSAAYDALRGALSVAPLAEIERLTVERDDARRELASEQQLHRQTAKSWEAADGALMALTSRSALDRARKLSESAALAAEIADERDRYRDAIVDALADLTVGTEPYSRLDDALRGTASATTGDDGDA